MATHQVFRQLILALILVCSSLVQAENPTLAQAVSRPKLLIQSGHHDSVNAVFYSPNGALIATASTDKKIKLWNATTKQLLNNLEGHSGFVSEIAFSPDSVLLASCGENNEVFIWHVQSGRLIHALRGHESGVNSVAFSPDGKTLATAGGLYEDVSDNTIRIWDVQTGRTLQVLKKHSSAVTFADFALNGSQLISVGSDRTIKLWSLPQGVLLNSVNTPDYVDAMSVLPGGQSFATVSNKVMTIRDVQGRPLRTIDLPSGAREIAFSRDARTFALVCATGRCVEIRSFLSGQVINRLNEVVSKEPDGDSRQTVNALGFSPDGKTLLTGGPDSAAKLWSRDTGRLVDTLKATSESTGVVAVSPDGKSIAIGNGRKIVIWNMQSGKPTRELPGHADAVRALAFNHDGTVLGSISSAEGLKVWSTHSGQSLWSFRQEGDDLKCLAFSHDGRFVAIGGVYIRVKVLNAQTGSYIRTLTVPGSDLGASILSPFLKAKFSMPMSGPSEVVALAFSPDDSLIAAGDLSFPINIWNVQSGRHLRTIKDPQRSVSSVSSVVFSRNGKFLVAGDSEKSLKFWSVTNGELLRSIDEADSVRSIALDVGGSFLASSTAAGTISLRNSSDGSLIREFKGNTLAVNSVAFSPDGKTLISGSQDATTKIWSMGDGRLLLTLISFKDSNWLTVTPEGFYESSAGALKYITWRSGDRLHLAAKYSGQLSKPELVRARLNSAIAPSIFSTAVNPPSNSRSEPIESTGTVEERLRREFPSKKFYALVIGNNKYRFMRPLETAVKDAEDVARVLADNFGFETKLLKDATRAEIMGEINRLKRELDNESNLLIYYAGHGYLDARVKKAYWWPVNAVQEDGTEWISADDITVNLKGMDVRHVLVVSDSCYSGAIPRGEMVGGYKLTERERYLRKMMFGPSRILMASGGAEPVQDNSGNGHSVFANAFLNGLRKMELDVFTAEELFYEYIRIPVAGKSDQTPQFDPLYNSGHDSGSFVFIRNRPRN